MTKVYHLLALLLFASLFFACESADKGGEEKTEQEPKREKSKIAKVYIASPGSTSLPFYTWKEGEDKPKGIEPRLLEYILNQANIEFEYVTDFKYDGTDDPRILAVVEGKADISMRGITITEERKNQVLFSEEYYTDGLGVLVRADSDLFTLEDLDGKNVYALRFSTTYDWVESNLIGSKLLSPEDFGIEKDPFELLAEGKIDAYLTDFSALKRRQKEKGVTNTRIFPHKFSKEGYGIAIAKDREDLKEKIDKVILEMKSSGRLKDFTSGFEK